MPRVQRKNLANVSSLVTMLARTKCLPQVKEKTCSWTPYHEFTKIAIGELINKSDKRIKPSKDTLYIHTKGGNETFMQPNFPHVDTSKVYNVTSPPTVTQRYITFHLDILLVHPLFR